MFKRMFVVVVASLMLVSCATFGNPRAAQLSPEGKAAYYGNQFMKAVEEAQNEVIRLVDSKSLTREQATPVIQTFVAIGRYGVEFANALEVIDRANATAVEKATAAERVRIALATFQTYLNELTIRVETEDARNRIAGIVRTLRIGALLLDVMRFVSPFMPQSMTPVPAH